MTVTIEPAGSPLTGRSDDDRTWLAPLDRTFLIKPYFLNALPFKKVKDFDFMKGYLTGQAV